MEAQRRLGIGVMYQVRLVGDMHACLRERRVVIGVERREMFGIALGRTVGAEKPVLKEDRHLRHDSVAVFVFRRRYLDRRQQVLLRVRAQDAYRELGTGEDHGFVQTLQHETQRRRRVTHRVRTVEDDEAVILLVPVIDHLRHLRPFLRTDVRGVKERMECLYIHLYLSGKKLRKVGLECLHICRHQSAGSFVAHHGDCAACGYQKNLIHCIKPILRCKITKNV